MSENAVDRLNRLIQIINLGGDVADHVLRQAEEAVAHMLNCQVPHND